MQAIKARKGAGLDLFCCDTSSIQGLSLFFSFLFLYLFNKPKHLFKNRLAVEAAKSNRLSSGHVEICLLKIGS